MKSQKIQNIYLILILFIHRIQENVYKKHPKGETVEDYYTVVSKSKWNNKDQASRADWDYKLPIDPSINPLKGLLKNE